MGIFPWQVPRMKCISLPFYTIPAGVYIRGRGPEPSDSPRRRTKLQGCLLIRQALRVDHHAAEDQDQEAYPVTTDSLDNIEEGVRDLSGGNVHPPPNSCNN